MSGDLLPEPPLGGGVRAEVDARGLGWLSLHRPEALNALSLAMVRDITRVLRHWQDDVRVRAVVLQGKAGADERRPPAFCAGGDIRALRQAALAGDPSLDAFFTEEYILDHLIRFYPKPIVAVMDGITMGGGMGLAQGASVRIVTERSRLAMPETAIGLFPDVGGGWFLSRCPGRIGEYLALSGHPLNADEALACGLADTRVDSGHLPGWIDAWAESPTDKPAPASGQILLRSMATPSFASADSFLLHRKAIDRHFAAATLVELLASLDADPSDWARETRAELARCSPLMMAVTLAQVRRARHMEFADVLRMERGMIHRCFFPEDGRPAEALEGIRAKVVDKDKRPQWSPADVAEVTPYSVGVFFDSPWPASLHPLRHLN